MAIKCYPLEGIPMLNTEWQQIFKNIYQGVATGLVVSADGGGLRVFVSAGTGGVLGHGVQITTAEELTITAGGASARVDKIVLDSVAPHLKVVSTVTATQYLLANVTVPANAVTIAAGNVDNVSKSIAQNLKDFLAVAWGDVSGKPSTFPASWGSITGKPSTFPPEAHTHTASQISDSGGYGRVLVRSTTAEQARNAIGAGTSNLVLGTTASTAKAGNYQPTWAQVTGKPSTFPPEAHTHTASQISDSGGHGRTVLRAEDAQTIRSTAGINTGQQDWGTTLPSAGTAGRIFFKI